MRNVKGQSMKPTKAYTYRGLGNLVKKTYIEQPEVFAPVKDVTEDYKKSLVNKKPVEVKSRFPNTDTKLWEPQPKRVSIGKGLWQYANARGN